MNGAIGFGLLSALIWGAGDFFGGLATKRARPFSVVLVAEVAGALLLALAGLALAQALPPLTDLGWSVEAEAPSGWLEEYATVQAIAETQARLGQCICGIWLVAARPRRIT